VGVTVGDLLSYDATKGRAAFTTAGSGALTYSITFDGAANGLSSIGATVFGQPQAPGVTWATIAATDARGRTVSDRFAIVAFAAGLAAPTFPATPFHYTDAADPLPAHFRLDVDGTSWRRPITRQPTTRSRTPVPR